MTIKLFKQTHCIVALVAILIIASVFVFSAGTAFAATKSTIVPVVVSSDNPHVNSDVNSPDIISTGVNTPGAHTATTTPFDDANLMQSPNAYTWRIDLSGVCSGAQLQSLRIVTQTITDTANPEPTSGVFLGVYGGDDLTMFDTYAINGGLGEDSNTWISALFGFDASTVDRGTSGTFGQTTTFPANAGLAGQLDATWDISSISSEDTLGFYIQHWLSGNATTAQTEILSATISYDDAGCASTPITGGQQITSTSNSSEQLASTGSSAVPFVVISVSLVLLFSLSIKKYILK